MEKFILTDEIIVIGEHTLYRIVAVRDLDKVKAGDKGGFVEKEANLDHFGQCWVYDDAIVMDDARISSNAIVKNNAIVSGNTVIDDNAIIQDNATVKDNANISGNAIIKDNAIVQDSAMINHHAVISGNAIIKDSAAVIDNSKVADNAIVEEYSIIRDKAIIKDNAKITHFGHVKGYAVIKGDAVVGSDRDYIPFRQWWNAGQICTWTRSNNKWYVNHSLYSPQELVDKAYNKSEENGTEFKRIVNYVQDILGEPQIDRSK